MAKQALPRIDLDSILLIIGFALLAILATIIFISKLGVAISSHTGETLYPHPTWTETED